MWQKNECDDEPAYNIPHDDLQKSKVGVISQTGNADDSERAGLCGNDREHDCPPWNVTSGQKVIAQRTLPLAEAHSKNGYPNQVDRDDGEVETIKAHVQPSA